MAFIPLHEMNGECKILGSDFLASVYPLDDVASFKGIYEAFKKKNPRADHYPYAYRLGGLSKSSDDGEPGGTAGVPLLSLLEHRNVEGCVIVARYFGGTKLGVPRLRRAFVSATEDALAQKGLAEMVSRLCYELEVDYSAYETIQSNAKRYGYEIADVKFDIKVLFKMLSSDNIDGPWERMGFRLSELPTPTTIITPVEVNHDPS